MTTALVLDQGPGCRCRARCQNTKILILIEFGHSVTAYVLIFVRFVLPPIPEQNWNQAPSTGYSALTSRKRKGRNDTTHRLKTRSCCVNNINEEPRTNFAGVTECGVIETFEAAEEDSADEDTRVSRLMMEGLTIGLPHCMFAQLSRSLCLCNYICHAVKNKHGNSSTTLRGWRRRPCRGRARPMAIGGEGG